MSINQWLQSINNPAILLACFVSLPVMAFFTGLLYQKSKGERAKLCYVYSALIYLTTIPGTFSISLIGYSLFFIRSNLLDVNFLVYFLPVISMFITLIIIGKQVEFSELPGFNRLSGLITLLLLTYGIILLIFKTRIFIGVFASMKHIIIFAVLVYFILKWSLKRL